MQTNKTAGGELRDAGQRLLDAAYEFWKVHQRECGPCAVVWLKDDDGRLVVFTRGEYASAIMQGIERAGPETPL